MWPRGATGLVTLSRGVHAIYVRYAQDGGPFHVELLWARAGEPLERIPAWALSPRRVEFLGLRIQRRAEAVTGGRGMGMGRLDRGLGADDRLGMDRKTEGMACRRRGLARAQVDPCGVADPQRDRYLVGLARRQLGARRTHADAGAGRRLEWFTHGWFDRYPPFHFYVLTVAFSPLMLLERLGRVDLSTRVPYALLTLIGRLVSLAAGTGTLLAVYAAGAQTFGRRAGMFAAAMFALVTPFVYYAKTANLDVPYLFWFAVSLVFYFRVLQQLALRDFIGLAACATLAVCTKDQAYGLFLLMPVAIVERLWRAQRDAGRRIR